MSEEHDGEERVLALGELYRRLTPPPLPDGIDESDAETARAVRWMQAAWSALEAPPVALPPSLATSTRARSARRALPWLVAAGVLAGGGALTLRALRAPQAPQNIRAASVVIEDVRADRLELRSGPVRLVLLTSPPRNETSSDPDSTGG